MNFNNSISSSFDLFRFKIFRLVLYILVGSIRVGLRLIYGKEKRNELFSSGRFPIYQKLKRTHITLLWSFPSYSGTFWEPKVSSLLKEIKGKLFVDIGASVGYYTKLLAPNFDKVLAVEPEPNSASKLRNNTKHLKNVCVVQAAISNEEGEATLYVSQTIGWHTITPQSQKVYTPTKVRTLKLETLLGDRTADLVKVDTEGAELKILDGTPANKVRAWLIEAHGGEPRKRELETKLMEKGYEIVWVTDNHIYAYAQGHSPDLMS